MQFIFTVRKLDNQYNFEIRRVPKHIKYILKNENENLYWDEEKKNMHHKTPFKEKKMFSGKSKKTYCNWKTHVTKELNLQKLVNIRMTLRSAGPCEK